MPLLHQDNSRGGGGPSDGAPRPCRTIAELLGIETMLSDPVGVPGASGNEHSEWSWEPPGSPEAAQTPRAMVPPTCFPPHHPMAFASFSESAQPGEAWNGHAQGPHSNHNGTEQGIHDLVTSLKAMTMCGASAGSAPAFETSPPTQIAMDMPEYWPADSFSNTIQLREDSSRGDLSRRASFCESGRNGCSVVRWSGQLPARAEEPEGGYSARLFLGGLPWDVSDASLAHALRHIGPLRMDWPGREQGAPPRGFAYVTLESERRVRALLAACRREHGCWYYRLPSRKVKPKEVQVIPWAVCDANWAATGAARLEATRTVFVGALHGMLSARALARVMNDLFAGVVYAGIDTDKYKYPIGSGRVTFDNVRSYLRAVSAAFIEIHTDKFTKKVQIDPYLEDSMCSVCNLQQGPYFCRQPTCFGYFCRSCWYWKHCKEGLEGHKALMRNSKSASSLAPRAPRAPAPPARDHALYNGHCATHKDGTPSPTTSGVGSDGEATSDEREPELWTAH